MAPLHQACTCARLWELLGESSSSGHTAAAVSSCSSGVQQLCQQCTGVVVVTLCQFLASCCELSSCLLQDSGSKLAVLSANKVLYERTSYMCAVMCDHDTLIQPMLTIHFAKKHQCELSPHHLCHSSKRAGAPTKQLRRVGMQDTVPQQVHQALEEGRAG